MERVCPECGHVNRAVGIFCAKCGHRLAEPAGSRPRVRLSLDLPDLLGGLLRIAFTVAFFVVVGLLLWPPKLPAPVSDPASARAFEAAMDRLLDAAERGRPATEVIPERLLNAYLAERVAEAGAGGGGGLEVKLRQLRVEFLPRERIRVTADSLYGPIRIVMAIAGKPEVVEHQIRFAMDEVRVGRLPLPVAAGGWIAQKIRATVAGLEREWQVLSRTQRLSIGEGRVEVVIAP